MMRPPDLSPPSPLPGTTPQQLVLVMMLLLLPFHRISTGIVAAESLSPTPTMMRQSSSWTFNEPGKSRISFFLPLSEVGIKGALTLELEFRTLQLNGVLLYQAVETYDHQRIEEEFKPLLDGFHLVVELRQGHIRVAHVFDHYTDVLSIGRALNDDKWHKVTLVLNQTNGELSVMLDTNSVTQVLKAYIWSNARDVLDWSRVKSSVQFGGMGGAAATQDYVSFVGCLRDLKYSKDGAILSNVPVGSRKGVTPGCIDRCREGSDRCKNNGRCVNLYTDYHCDCFGTDYEGRTCGEKGPSVLTLSGYEWVTFELYQGEENRPLSDYNRVSLEFKTERPSGILLYAVGRSPYHNHVTASLTSGSLHVSVAFGDDDLDFPIGLGLDDSRWHNLTIVHASRNVSVYLDGDVTSRYLNSSNFFLSLDRLVYIGGGDNFVVTRGLPVTRNFIGCLQNVYYNDQSVLYKLSRGDKDCRYYGGKAPTFGCSPVENIPISFPNTASMLRWPLGSMGENMSISFQFRTVRENGILFYLELLSTTSRGGLESGLIEVWILKGHPVLMFVPSLRNKNLSENITLPSIVNDGVWHTMHIELKESQAKLKVDAVSRSTVQHNTRIRHKGQVILGFGLRGYKVEGYVGCMNEIVIQGRKLDPISVVESSAAIGLLLDGCNLVDYCKINNICEHDSKCLSDWTGVQCNCKDDSYEGKACHFARYPPTCDAYYQAGHLDSGVYLIDMDGAGPQEPTYVQCSMGSQRDSHLYGVTIVEHNFHLNTHVRGHLFEDRRYNLSYREMERVQLMMLGETSAACEQFFKYTCQNSPILLGKKTYFKSANGQVVDYLGGSKSGFCTCPNSDDGTCDGKRCNCDHGSAQLDMDEGYSHTREELPIMEMTFLQNFTSHGTANMTLGPYTCWGSEKQHLSNLLTLTTDESHVAVPAWKRGALGIHFKTHHDRALLLMQTSSNTSSFHNIFTLKIISDNSLQFYFKINGTTIRKTLRTHRKVNQGDWHYVYIEHDPYNVRLTLDTSRKLVKLNPAISGLLDFDSVMYIGGLPKAVASRYEENTPGFSGCVRAFLYNEREVELSDLIDGSVSGVSAGCMSSCWPNPCQHGGTCKEDWGEYTCICQDPWAHQGHDCEHNLNVDAATFTGETSSYLFFNLTKQSNPLDQTIVISFRTFQSNTLLFYAFDHLSNFVMMELQRGDTIVFTYNTFRTIVSGYITAPQRLNDGEWRQVVAQEYYNLTKLIVADQILIIEHKRIKMNTYFIDPFKGSAQKESVFISRSVQEPDPFVWLYVGGLGEEVGGTPIPFLKGCVRGMRIGKVPVNLAEGVLARGPNSNLTGACDRGCYEDTCMNNGYCYEHWRYGNFTCDCSESDFSGLNCEKEASVLLDGQTVLEHTFTLPQSAHRSVTEQLALNFRSTGTKVTNEQGEIMDMALIYIKSSQSSDYILAKLDSGGNVLIETNQGVGIYRMKVPGKFDNGELHELFYKREGTNMYLTIDGIKEAKIVYPDYDLDQINTILIGGLLNDEENTFEDTTNFTGCISNTVFRPEANLEFRIRSLKDFNLDSPDIITHGPDVISCSEAMLTGRRVTEAPKAVEVTSQRFEILTMPPWNVGSAALVTLSPPIVLTRPPSSTTTRPPAPSTSRSNPVFTQSEAQDVDDFTVIIAVSVIAFILIITLIVALLLFKKRRQHYNVKKDAEMMELKKPLNYSAVPSVQSSPVPPDHLAKLDEFSMITALLGPKSTPNNTPVTNQVKADANRNSVGSLPKADEPTTFEHPIFNKRKQRPASSISEVLEELERRQNRHSGSAENVVGRPHGEGELEWDPQADRTPLTYEDITFFNTPLLAPIVDENEDSHVSSLSEQNSELKEKQQQEESSPSAADSQGNQNSLLDGNGDSGYEAESRPEVTEDDVTPTEEEVLNDEEEDPTHPKLYMYNISNIEPEDSPILTSPTERLLKKTGAES